MHLLLTGASGFVGSILYRSLASAHAVTGLCHTHDHGLFLPCDLTDTARLPALLDRLAPDVLIHSAAVRDPDRCEREPRYAHALHATATEACAAWCNAHDRTFIYISTDLVFDGTAPPYREASPPRPLSVYGETKRLGELAAATARRHMIVRIPLQYGFSAINADSFVAKAITALAHGAPMELDDSQIRYPTLSAEVAATLLELITRNFQGIIHLSAATRTTRFAMWQTIADVFGLSAQHLTRATHPAPSLARRPHDSALATPILDALGLPPYHSFHAGLLGMKQQMEQPGCGSLWTRA